MEGWLTQQTSSTRLQLAAGQSSTLQMEQFLSVMQGKVQPVMAQQKEGKTNRAKQKQVEETLIITISY